MDISYFLNNINDPGVLFSGMGLALIGWLFFVGIISYVYFSLTLMIIAKKLKNPNYILAWIPIANLVLLSQLAEMHWWPVLMILLSLIPFVGWIGSIILMIYEFIWLWKTTEKLHKPGWWVLLLLIPAFGAIWSYILFGILAWGKKK